MTLHAKTSTTLDWKFTSCAAALLLLSFSAESKIVATLTEEKSTTSDNVIVTVIYKNEGRSPMLVRAVDIPRTGENGKLRSDAVHVVGIDGSMPAYTGYYVNLPRTSLERNLTIAPGESLRRTIDVSHNYDLRAGMAYDITLSAYRQSRWTDEAADHHKANFIYTTMPTIRIIAP